MQYTEEQKVASSIYSSMKQRAKKQPNMYDIDKTWPRDEFIKWYINKEKVCCYCGHTEERIQKFLSKVGTKRNNRGNRLEIERKEDREYSESNCDLCCYICNMTKSDIFTHENFQEVGVAIGSTIYKILKDTENKLKLPFEMTYFDPITLVEHLERNNLTYIIIGAQHVKFSDHTKHNSLDYWLRENIAKNKDTCQISNNFIGELCSFNLFRQENELVCNNTGRKCKGIILTK